MRSDLPHVGRTPALAFVMGCHCPFAPAHISGGSSNVLCMSALETPSRDTERLARNPSACASKGPCHIISLCPVDRSSLEIPLPTPTCSVSSSLSGESHCSEFGVD